MERNPVAKHQRKFNKAQVHIDRKKQSKTKPKDKHKRKESEQR